MRKSTETPNQPEVKVDGNKLIIDGIFEVNIEAVKNMFGFCDPKELKEGIDNVIYSLAQTGAFLIDEFGGDKEKSDDVRSLMPNSSAIFMLKVVSDSLKLI